MNTTRTGGSAAAVLSTLVIVLVLLVGIGLSMGWVSFSDSPEKSTIEIDKVQLKEDTDKAATATKEMINNSAKSLKDAANDVEHATENALSDENNDETSPMTGSGSVPD